MATPHTTTVMCLAVALFMTLLSLSAANMQRVVFPVDIAQSKSALCLDGSPAGYYVEEHPDSEGWAIYLEGGGLCVEAIDCLQRAKGNEGSSKGWSATFTDTTNVLADTAENPFANFSKVWVPYCSGDMYTGSTIKNHLLGGLATCGLNIVDTVVEHLFNTTSFAKATNLFVSGGSAGGFGAFHHADRIGDNARALGVPLTRYKVSPQAGYFFSKNVCLFETYALGSDVPFDLFASSYVNIIEGSYINPACAKAMGDLKKRCWDVDVLQRYLKTPLFVAQNLVDQQQVNDELLCPGNMCNNNFKRGGIAEKYMQDYMNKTTDTLKAHIAAHPANGLFAPSCFSHTGDLCMTIGPQINGVSYAQALGAWYFETNKYPTVLMDTCDDGPICNHHCGSGCGDA